MATFRVRHGSLSDLHPPGYATKLTPSESSGQLVVNLLKGPSFVNFLPPHNDTHGQGWSCLALCYQLVYNVVWEVQPVGQSDSLLALNTNRVYSIQHMLGSNDWEIVIPTPYMGSEL